MRSSWTSNEGGLTDGVSVSLLDVKGRVHLSPLQHQMTIKMPPLLLLLLYPHFSSMRKTTWNERSNDIQIANSRKKSRRRHSFECGLQSSMDANIYSNVPLWNVPHMSTKATGSERILTGVFVTERRERHRHANQLHINWRVTLRFVWRIWTEETPKVESTLERRWKML